MKEIWKGIEGFSKYEVSSKGRVRSLDRVTKIEKSEKITYANIKGKVLKPQPNKNTGRLYVNLYDKDAKRKNVMISRLVAETFIPNPLNLPEVNHKDRNVENNEINNLEWVTPKGNMAHLEEYFDHDFGRTRVTCTDLKTGEKRSFISLKMAAEWLSKKHNRKTWSSGISNVVHGRRNSYLGYHWERSNVETIESID